MSSDESEVLPRNVRLDLWRTHHAGEFPVLKDMRCSGTLETPPANAGDAGHASQRHIREYKGLLRGMIGLPPTFIGEVDIVNPSPAAGLFYLCPQKGGPPLRAPSDSTPARGASV